MKMKKRETKKHRPKPEHKPVEEKREPQREHRKVTWKPGTMIYPLPVVMVSCGNKEKGYNIVTVAWTGIVSTDPAMCYISLRPLRFSFDIIKGSKEFCINLTTEELAHATDWCGVKSGKDSDKFTEMRLTPMPCKHISAPMIAESPLNLECKVKKILPLGSHHMFLAEIVAVHASGRLINPESEAFELARANLITYSHGNYYTLGHKIGKFGFSVEKKKKKRHVKPQVKPKGTGSHQKKLQAKGKRNKNRNREYEIRRTKKETVKQNGKKNAD
jgi:flavin reductase (DIM6/NTAB) family NADH-FMN oxidoreductase RutF